MIERTDIVYHGEKTLRTETSPEHKVVVKSKEKIMFKLSIIDKDFDWVCTNWSNCFKGFKYPQ